MFLCKKLVPVDFNLSQWLMVWLMNLNRPFTLVGGDGGGVGQAALLAP